MKKKKNIIFAGDSFTWGEGLSLYLDKEPWISQRKKKSEWFDILELQTQESKLFREKYRFPTAVADYFNCKPIVKPKNGGGFRDMCDLIEKNINDDTFAVVLQFTNIMRMHLHLRPNICKCKYCEWSRKNNFVVSLFDSYYHVVLNHTNEKSEAPFIWWKNIEFLKIHQTNPYPLLNFEQWNELSTEDKEIWIDNFTKTLPITFDREIRKQFSDLAVFLKEEVENRGIPVFFIDTWDGGWTRRMIIENKYLMDRMITLESEDGTKWDNWFDWKNTVKPHTIEDEFPNTNNHHPTMTSHKLLYKSIVNTFKDKLKIKSNKKLSYYENINNETEGSQNKSII